MTTMFYQGHGSYRLHADDGTVVYVDPSMGEGYDVPADVIIVTHEHPDHNEVDKMPHADGCEIVRATDLQPTPGEYVSVETHGITITGVQACNDNHPIDKCVGAIISIDGISFYAAGDTSMTDDMKSGKLAEAALDYATFPADGFYNMDIDEATECARLVQAAHSIPMHLVPVHDPSDPNQMFDREKAEKLDVPSRIIVEPGETLKL